jgi:hypothetical protein
LQTKIVEITKQKDSIYCAERNALLVPLAKALIALGYDAGLGKLDTPRTKVAGILRTK